MFLSSEPPGDPGTLWGTSRKHRAQAIFGKVAVLVWFALLAVVLTWPLAAQLGTHLLGARWDTEHTGAAWASWWFRTALAQGLHPWRCPWILYPVGSSDLLARMGISLNFLLAAPVMEWIGFIRGYNSMILAIVALNGIAGYALGRQVGGDRVTGVALGTFLVASSFLQKELMAAHPDNANLSWLLLFFAAALSFLERGGGWRMAGAGLTLVLAAATFPGFAYLAALATPVLALGGLARAEVRLDRRFVTRLLLLAGCCAVALAPFVLIWGQGSSGRGANVGGTIALPWTATVEALSVQERIIVDGSMRWWGGPMADLMRTLPNSLALLALWGLLRAPRRAVPWLVVLLLFGLLSTGPYLQVPGPHRGIDLVPTPLLWAYRYLPFLDRWRFPIRFLWMSWIALAALAALGVHALLQSYASGPLRVGALAGVFVLFGYENVLDRIISIPASTWVPQPPPRHYLELAERGEDLAIIQVPVAVDKPTKEEERHFQVANWISLDQYYQSRHGVRTVAGAWMSQSLEPLWLDFLQRNSLMAAVMAWQNDQAGPAVDGQDLADLRALGFREVILNTRYLEESAAAHLAERLTWLLGPPVEEEEGVLQVYLLPAPPATTADARPWPLRRVPAVQRAGAPEAAGLEDGTLIEKFERGDLDGVRRVAALAPTGGLNAAEAAMLAVAQAEAAAAGSPDEAALAALVSRYQEAGYPARATARLLAEVQARPESAWLHLMLAGTYAYRGMPALALASRAEARRLDPAVEADPPELRTPAALFPVGGP